MSYASRSTPLVRLHWALWVGLLLISTAFRFTGPNWDNGIAAHPDERFLVGVAAEQPLYSNVCTTVPDFPYGHLPVTVGRLLALTAPGADPLYAARLVAALVGVLLVAVSGACGIVLAGRQGGLVAGAVASFAPLLIQTAHFYTVDPFAALFVTVAVLAARRKHWYMAGAAVGLATACKASAAVVVLPLLVSAVVAAGQGRGLRPRPRFREAVRMGGGALLAFGAVSPWSFLTPVACWRGPLIQSLMASGRYVFPYTEQYAGTLPYVYPLVQMGLWGLGPTATLFGIAGLMRGLQAGWRGAWRYAVTAGSTLLLFLSIGGLHVKFTRYMLLLYPWWIAWAAYACLQPGWRDSKFGSKTGARIGELSSLVRGAAVVLLVGVTALLGLAQVSIYARPHPWVAASQWLYARHPDGAVITVEAWDHPLPVPLGADDVQRFTQVTLPIFDEDGASKSEALAGALAGADVIIVATRRGYGALARQPERYRETLAWYEAVFSSRDGVVFARCPRVGPVAISDDPLRDAGFHQAATLAERCGTPYALRLPRLDESSRVYDAPFVLLFPR